MIKVSYQGDHNAVIVVGGNSGIGQALSRLCLQSNIKVIAIDIQEESSLEHPALSYFQADPLVKDELSNLLQSIQVISQNVCGLINLSGTIQYFDTIEKALSTDWDDTFDISFKSCLHSCQVFSNLLKNQKGAAIVNMSSGLAFIGQKKYGPYSAAKAAIVSLTKTLAKELAPNIRVNSIAPGAVNTPFIYGSDGSTRFDLEGYKSRVPTGDIAQPYEIAHVIMYLLSDGANHISGECVHVNGGVG